MERIGDFHGLVAVVTGGTSGIGRSIAEALGAAGSQVVITGMEQHTAAVAAEIGATGFVVDVRDPAAVAGLAEAVVGEFGRVDVVVNNAGVGPLARFDDLSLDDVRWAMDVNYWGVVHGLRTFLPLLERNPEGGYVITTASVAALLPGVGMSAYAASKAAVVSLCESVAAETAERGIAFTIVLPARVRSNIVESAELRPGRRPDSPRADEFLPPLPVLEPDDVAAQVLDALRTGRRYVITHPQVEEPVRQQQEAVLTAFADRRRGAERSATGYLDGPRVQRP